MKVYHNSNRQLNGTDSIIYGLIGSTSQVPNDLVECQKSFLNNLSDDDFQPIIQTRKRTIRDSTGKIGAGKKFKGKDKIVDTEVAATFSFQNMNENLNDAEADMEVEGSLNITLDDYNFDDTSDNFVEYITTKYDVGESSKQAGNTSNPVSLTVQSNATSSSVPKDSHSSTTSVDPEFVLKSVKKLNEPHEPSDAIPDRRMAVKTIVRSIWKQEYMQLLYNLDEKAKNLCEKMKANGSTEEAIKSAIRKEVYQPCNQVKQAIIKKETPESGLLDAQSLKTLTMFYASYRENYSFQKNSIYYDEMARPENHFKAFFKLASQLKAENKLNTWGAVVNLRNKAFKNQGFDKSVRFQGTLETDGVGISVIKQNMDTNRKISKAKNTTQITVDQTKYIEGISQSDLRKTEGNCVLIDPGRRDLMYCLKETSKTDDKKTLTYTKMNRTKMQRHLRLLREKTKPEIIKAAEVGLSKTESFSLKIESYSNYIKARASVDILLREYYGNETYNTTQVYFPNSCFEFNLTNKVPPNAFTNFQIYATYLEIMMQQHHVKRRLKNIEKAEILKIAEKTLETGQVDLLRKRASQLLEKLQILPFRKLKFSSKLYFDKNDAQLVRKLKNKFGSNSTLILGNWSAPNVKYQEPTRSKGLIATLKKNGFKLYLIDEYKTSSFCPECESPLEKFKTIVNPRPYQRRKMPTITCHGLLRCKNIACRRKMENTSGIVARRMWNRDLAAALNFKKILIHLRETGKRPPLFSREKAERQ
ncbi:hypothetical protein MFLAVUS_010728 [Mucor flavus]|uniref:Uncharacterized protein n=1 Tax=Mucor flavus TaxID=439312 RepID=A0ABP9ZDP5_9FUNG